MTELWRDVPGYAGYQVSDAGRVLSVRGVLQPWSNRGGYQMVSLRHEGRSTKLAVHRLVALAFLPRPDADGVEVCHINGDPKDNRLENLRWGTRSENIRDQVAHGTHNNARKTHCPQGHEYTASNTYLKGRGRRQCVACTKAKSAARYSERKQVIA